MKEFPMGIGQLARRVNTSPENIRYYENQRLIPRAARTSGGHRQYGEAHLRQLTFVLRARELGFSQADVRALLALADVPDLPCDRILGIAECHLIDVRKKIADLRKLERALARLVTRCKSERRASECPVVESLYHQLPAD